MLTRRLDRPVLDLTGLKGTYDFTIDLSGLGFGGSLPPAESTGPSVFTAVQNDLGLKLEGRKQPIDILILTASRRFRGKISRDATLPQSCGTAVPAWRRKAG